MRACRTILLAAALLSACGQTTGDKAGAPATTQGPNALDLQIEIGRYGVMLGQVRELTAQRTAAGEADPADPRELGRALRETVWSYNLERSQLCAKGLFTQIACGPAYEPVWISEPANAAPTLEEVQSRSAALGEEVQNFWDAVCADARAGASEEAKPSVCAIE